MNGDARAAVALGPSTQAGLAGLLRWEERAVCWAGRAGKELGRPGRGKRAGPGERNGPAGERGGLRVGLRRFWVFWVLGFAFSISKLF